MLVLLIIFMVTAPMMIKGAQVSLPEAEMSNIKTTEEITVVSVDKNMQIYINDYQTTIEAFPEKLDRAFFNKKDKEVLLKADKETIRILEAFHEKEAELFDKLKEKTFSYYKALEKFKLKDYLFIHISNSDLYFYNNSDEFIIKYDLENNEIESITTFEPNYNLTDFNISNNDECIQIY